jgi:hypothetical protein
MSNSLINIRIPNVAILKCQTATQFSVSYNSCHKVNTDGLEFMNFVHYLYQMFTNGIPLSEVVDFWKQLLSAERKHYGNSTKPTISLNGGYATFFFF